MVDSNRRLVAKILLFSAIVFAILAALSWSGTLPMDPTAHRLFALAFGICAAAHAVIGLILWTGSQNS